jgi:alpha-tubulin suppressor-like RCC1 family protein
VQTVAGGTNWKQVAPGIYHTAAIKTDGTLWTWGQNTYGQLGDNTTTHKSSPVQTVAGGTNWKQVACGNHTAAIKTDGTLWTWGRDNYGQLGDNTTANKSSPVQTVAGGTNWKQVSSGTNHTAAIKTDGTLWTWGRDNYGQLGNNTTANKSSPVQTVAGGTNWKQVAGDATHTAAIKTDGTLWMWGYNLYGQLGNNTITSKSSPVQTVAGGTNWKQISCGYHHTIAIKTDGTLWTWGYDNYGQLGNNTITSKSSPVQTVAGGTNWKQVAGGGYHTIAISEGDNW